MFSTSFIIFIILLLIVFCYLYSLLLYKALKRKAFLKAFLLIIVFFNYSALQCLHDFYQIPKGIKVKYPVTLGTEGDMIDGCDVTVFKLSNSTITNIRNKGVSFLYDTTKSTWRESPHKPIWDTYYNEDTPMRCRVINKNLLSKITEALKQNGSYYNDQFIIIPALELIISIDVY